jgi:energy-coupling factor transporter ATP-binding protein EcfA2
MIIMEFTTISVSSETRDKLKTYGMKGDTYDKIINRILEKIDREEFLEECYQRLSEKNKFVKVDLDDLK